jgi:hypothetical protein
MFTMKTAIGGIAFILGLALAPLPLRVHASSNVVISEIQPGSEKSASEEFIKISNNSSASIDVSSWRIEYFSAIPKSFSSASKTIKLNGTIQGYGDYILASNGYKTDVAQTSFIATLAAVGGHLRIVSGEVTNPVVYDLVGWGTAIKPETKPVAAPLAGEVLERSLDSNGRYIDSDNNEADFSGQVLLNESASSFDSNKIVISELMPNPASPVTDAVGEFIELYNPNNFEVKLKGYKLLTGINHNHSFIFDDQSLRADEYRAYFVTETKASLANSSGMVQLQSPDGNIVDETLVYQNAISGQAWIWDDTTWVWSTQPTPNARNITTDSSETKPEQTSKPKTAKKAAIKKAKTSNGKVKGAKTAAGAQSEHQPELRASPLHSSVLAGVGGLAVLYGIYEYRTEITNAFRKLRGNRGNRT